MSNYEIIKEKIAANKEMKRGYNYCNAIIMLSGTNINSLKEEQLMLLEARLNAYEQVWNKRKPGQTPMLEGLPLESWREAIEIRYAYLKLIEEGKLLDRALFLETAIQENTKVVQQAKAINKECIMEMQEIMEKLIVL